MKFELWYDENIKELRIKWAENGADREMDFDEEEETMKEYEKYLDEGVADGLELDSETKYLKNQ